MVVKHIVTSEGKHYGYWFHCPGCNEKHVITTEPYPNGWKFDDNEQSPTVALPEIDGITKA